MDIKKEFIKREAVIEENVENITAKKEIDIPQCNVCWKIFSKNGNLKLHIIIH